jgi:AAA family ATP:ADP antiporter
MQSPGSNSSGAKDYLEEESWQKMGTKTSLVSEFMEKLNRRMSGSMFHFDEDRIRVLWLSTTLFFTVGGYWLLRSLKDPIISIIDGVRHHMQ